MKYIALLRGINVSGQKIIKMADLRAYLTKAGFNNVNTYIQSGNIVFESSEINTALLEDKIKGTIEQYYGFIVPTIVLTLLEIEHAISKQPFKDIDDKRLYLTYLSQNPDENGMEKLLKYQTNGEELKLIGKVLYMYSPNGVARSKLTNNLVEKNLAVSATTRNWRTSNKLLVLLTQ